MNEQPTEPAIAMFHEDESVRRSLSRVLTASGCQSFHFLSAEGLLDNPQHPRFDCLIMDLQLGGMSGIDLQERLAVAGLNIPMILMTARHQKELDCLGLQSRGFTLGDVAGRQWRLGPEFFVGKASEKRLIGIFPSHQWDVAGWDAGEDNLFSTTQIQPFLKYLPGGGWAVGSQPIMDYDWEGEEWTIPVNLTVSKALKWGNTLLKLERDLNYYVE